MLKDILQLTGKRRNANNNASLGVLLAFLAGAINAGGFFLVNNYTSHMTGIISAAADNIAVGEYFNALLMIFYIICFVLGAMFTALITLVAKKYHLNSQYALPLILEALIIAVFSLLWIFTDIQIPYFISALCFLMGLQNALIAKASSAIIRTTHISGMATDLGIEIGRYIFFRRGSDIASNLNNAKRHIAIISFFFIGGILGAISVKSIGVYTFLALSTMLALITFPIVFKDLAIYVKLLMRRK
jgi:uncharacterized membrane protein YoaK (UPF0700 family)